jgi:hypothetical protein
LNSKDLCSTCRLKGLKIYDFFFLKGHWLVLIVFMSLLV